VLKENQAKLSKELSAAKGKTRAASGADTPTSDGHALELKLRVLAEERE
jgi:hypothetical protein